MYIYEIVYMYAGQRLRLNKALPRAAGIWGRGEGKSAENQALLDRIDS